jgi:Na+-driven multidrug efflux pump
MNLSAYSYPALAAVILNMGVMGIVWAMCLDWMVKGSVNLLRLRSGKWKKFKVI